MDNQPTWYKNKIKRNTEYTLEHYTRLKFKANKDEMKAIKATIKKSGMNNREFLENALELLKQGKLDKELEIVRDGRR